jgi:hypothetical protein
MYKIRYIIENEQTLHFTVNKLELHVWKNSPFNADGASTPLPSINRDCLPHSA